MYKEIMGVTKNMNLLMLLFLWNVILLLSPDQSYAQQKIKTFDHYNVDHGMSANVTQCIIQDSKGYLWFGTYYGITRFDGYIFTTYTNEPGNPNSINDGTVQALCEDRDGNIWVGTSSGLQKLDIHTGKFEQFLMKHPGEGTDFGNYVLSISEDKYGMLWVGTADGLYKLDKNTGRITAYINDPADSGSLGNNFVSAILEDRDGTLWIGTGNGLDKFDRESNTFVRYWHDPKNTTVIPEVEWNRVLKYHVTYQINSIYEDMEGLLWLCTNGQGLIEFNKTKGTYKAYTSDTNDPQGQKGLSSNWVTSICEDKDGNYWIGTEYDGVNVFNKRSNSFTHYMQNIADPGGLDNNNIFSILCERSGTIWISTFSGLNKLNRTKQPFVQYNKLENSWDQSLQNSASYVVKCNDILWVQTYPRVHKFDPKTGTFTLQNSVLMPAGDTAGIWMFPLSDVSGMYTKDEEGKFIRVKYVNGQEFNHKFSSYFHDPASDTTWVGTVEGGILCFDKRSKTISMFDSLHTSIQSIYRNSFGELWVGTRDAGLFRYVNTQETRTRFTPVVDDPTSITGNFVTVIIEDENQNMWFGTSNGLNKFVRSTNSFIHYTRNDGLVNNWIFAIQIDERGNLWFATNNGITRLNPETGEVRNYDKSYGLSTNRFGYTSGKTQNGELYFAGPGGLTRFHPDDFIDNPYIPPIVITSLHVFEKPVRLGEGMTFPHNQNFFAFEYAALSYVSPERNTYAYKMEGVDIDWVYAGTRRYASYPNLEPGNYIFRVKGTNNDGVWNEAGTSISIIILPPWWRTNLAYFIYALIILSGLYWIRIYEMNRIRLKDKIKLDEAVLKEREETDKMKSRFFANISHEFRTPLTLILGPAEKINSKTSNDITKDSGIIKRYAKHLLQLVNQLLDLSRLEAGKLQLQASKGNIVSFVRGVTLFFESLAERKGIELKIIVPQNDIELYFDRDKLGKILTNLLSNAFKFTIEGKITVTLRKSPGGEEISTGMGTGKVEIAIADTGIGISEEELPKLFDRFYQVDSSQTREHEGTGIGLALAKELVELHHGKIHVTSIVGAGSEFIVELPVGRDHLRDDEIYDEDPRETVILSEFPSGEPGVKSLKSDSSEPKDDAVRHKDGQVAIYLQDGADEEQDKTIILVVEDNADVRAYIKDSLGEGFKVEETSNGEQGVLKAVEIIPDLIISDIMMPKMDGNELTRRIKNDERTSHIPVILLTAKSEQESKLQSLETGADDYLTKPFDTKELLVRINNLINIRRKLQEKYSGKTIVTAKTETRLSKLDEKFLIKVLEVVENHLPDEDFSIEEFANEVGMGRVQLHRKLKALTGKSPSVYLRSLRLARAKTMIEEKYGNISEIAYSTGFSSPAYFSACFKAEYGYSPSEVNQ